MAETRWTPGPWRLYDGDSDAHYIIVAGEYAAEGEPDMRADIVTFNPLDAKIMAQASEMFDIICDIARCRYRIGETLPDGTREVEVVITEPLLQKMYAVLAWIKHGKPHGPSCGCWHCERTEWTLSTATGKARGETNE